MPQIKTPSNFAPAQIDLAFIVEKDLLAQKVKEEILSFPFVILAELFDEFESFRFGKNRKNIAFHIWLEGREKTLTNREIQAFSKQIISRIEKKFRAQLRKF